MFQSYVFLSDSLRHSSIRKRNQKPLITVSSLALAGGEGVTATSLGILSLDKRYRKIPQ